MERLPPVPFCLKESTKQTGTVSLEEKWKTPETAKYMRHYVMAARPCAIVDEIRKPITLWYGNLKPRARTSSSTNLVNIGVIRWWNTAPGNRMTSYRPALDGPRYPLRRSGRSPPSHKYNTNVSRSACSSNMMSCQKPTCRRTNPGTSGFLSPPPFFIGASHGSAPSETLQGVTSGIRHGRPPSRGGPGSRARPLSFVGIQGGRGEKNGPHVCVGSIEVSG